MFSGGRSRCGGEGIFQQEGRRQRGDHSSEFEFSKFLNRGDVVGFEALEKQDGDTFFQPLTFWSGFRKLKVNDQAVFSIPDPPC